MTFDSEDDRRYPMFAVDTSKGGGVDSLTREPEKTKKEEEEEEHPATKEPAKEKTHHA